MSRSKNSRRTKSAHVGRELWSKRPLSGFAHNAENKRLSRKIERARLHAEIRKADEKGTK